MPVVVTRNAFVVPSATSLNLSQMFGVTGSASNATYLVLTALDRNEYTVGATGATGSLSGNGRTASFASTGGDSRGAGIVFTYVAASGRYYSSVYGYLDQIIYTASGSASDITNLSLFATSNAALATSHAGDPYSMMQLDAAGYIGSVTVATRASFTGPVPAQATPGSIAAIAASFVGQAWNRNGCWVLASTIAAEAGASLPLQSTAIGLAGRANGEWIVAFNGPAGQTGNWQSMVTAGEIVVIGTPGGGGHITTCVSGSGATARLVDNAAMLTSYGQLLNPAGDGSGNDIIVAPPHLASIEWAGVAASSVVIYELDTPVVTVTAATASLACGTSRTVGPWFAATDPAGKAVTRYQVYDTASGDSLTISGSSVAAHSADTAVTVAALSSVQLMAGVTACIDVLDVRAFNGTYWGDWTALTVNVVAAAPAALPPRLASQTPNQIWLQGAKVSLALGRGTFADPQGQAMTYTATLANGQALPGWLAFNATTETFTGVVPAGVANLSLKVIATDTSGLSASDTFQVSIPAAAPVLALPTSAQSWIGGQKIAFALPAATFADPQSQTLRYTATLSTGKALPAWLRFDAASETFSGTAPITAQTLSLKVSATNASGLAVSEFFSATVQASAPVLSHQTAAQTWIDGQTVSFLLPANTFADPLGQKMIFAATQMSGVDVSSWLHFNTSTAAFSGLPPLTASGTISLNVVATNASGLSASETLRITLVPIGGHVA